MYRVPGGISSRCATAIVRLWQQGSVSQVWFAAPVQRVAEHFPTHAGRAEDSEPYARKAVEIHCGGATRILSETLTGLERKLDPGSFLRVHRCRILNVSRIRAVHPLGHGAYALELRDNMWLTTGRQFRGGVEALLRK